MAIRASRLAMTQEFLDDVRALRSTYPDLDRAVNELSLSLLLDYEIRQIVVEASNVRTRYGLLEHASGDQVRPLAVLFDATPANPSPMEPYRTITLRRVVEVKSLPGTPSAVA